MSADDIRLVLIVVGVVWVPIAGVVVYLRWQRKRLDRKWDAFFDEHGASMREHWAQMDPDDLRKGLEALDEIGMLDRTVDGVLGAERKAASPDE